MRGRLAKMEAMMNNPLVALTQFGQSVWCDNLSRELIRSGELKSLVERDGVSGITSNPTIFQKAISQDRGYDNDIHELVDEGKTVEEIYEHLAADDIRETADILSGIYEKSSGADGYVSLEVSPHLAYDTNGTIDQVKHLFELVGRKNVMIKIPATPQGMPAISEAVAAGINVNITLIFSLEQYRDAATAYIEGIERLAAAGGDVGTPASVASFFVSRVDTMIDERLKDVLDPRSRTAATQLLGKAAIANARLAYVMYKEIFFGERFSRLAAQGARRQRLLWGSTSTKNPTYPDTYYVDELIGPDTVNTIPPVTLNAYRDHGKPASTLEEGLEEARGVFEQLNDLGIDVPEVMDRLLEDGVKSFADSYDALLAEISKKRTRLLRGWGHRSASLGAVQKRVDETLLDLDNRKISEGIWTGDASIWCDGAAAQAAINQRLGWLQVVESMAGEKQRLTDFVEEIRAEGFTTVVLLGMGGSSLASEVFASLFGPREGYLDLKVLDTTVPGSILDLEGRLDMDRTLFIVSSKSGGTLEVTSLYKYFRSKMEQRFGDQAGRHFVAITDPGTGLGKLASEHRFRRVFLNPPDVGGRFSALSYFGLVPAALVGVDLDHLLMRAGQAVEASGPGVTSLESPGVWLGVVMGDAALSGRDKLTLLLSPGVSAFGGWLEQLIAESTGKNGTGVLPIDGEPLGAPDKYGTDRLFVYLRLDDAGTFDSEVSTLEQAGHPVVTLRLHSPYDVGREMFRWEFATAVAGSLLGINPFDEPNVQEAKDLTRKFLESYQKQGNLPALDRVDGDSPDLSYALNAFLEPVKPGDYVAFNAFIQPTAENRSILQTMRALVRDRFSVATAVGFGPRYLHSTGQIHKGGADTGHFILLTADDAQDVPIPGAPYSFGVLKSAQSMGDYEALKKRGRRILNVHLKSEAGLAALLGCLHEPA